ncbi:MAG: DUF2939 domain-containing protein, partial [Methyloceanibacter sp.]
VRAAGLPAASADLLSFCMSDSLTQRPLAIRFYHECAYTPRHAAMLWATVKFEGNPLMRRLFLLILILLAVYVAYPYWTLHRLEQALLSNNAEALKRIVDFPAIGASMKDKVEGRLLEKSDQLGEKRPVLGDIGTALTNILGPVGHWRYGR